MGDVYLHLSFPALASQGHGSAVPHHHQAYSPPNLSIKLYQISAACITGGRSPGHAPAMESGHFLFLPFLSKFTCTWVVVSWPWQIIVSISEYTTGCTRIVLHLHAWRWTKPCCGGSDVLFIITLIRIMRERQKEAWWIFQALLNLLHEFNVLLQKISSAATVES